MHTNILIIGAGPAGFNAAKSACGKGKKVTLAGSEPYLPYWRPRLPEIIRTGASIENIFMRKPDWYNSQGIEVLTQKKAVQIDTVARTVEWNDGSSIDYDSLILACGAVSNVPKFPLAKEIRVLRTYTDAIAIREECKKLRKAFVIGGGVLGLETAFAVAETGCMVSVSDISQYPLPRQLDKEGGLFFKQLMEKKGIHIYCAEAPDVFKNDVKGACVIAAAGVHASTDLPNTCGIRINRGILVDEAMKTSVSDIYACGDDAEFFGIMPGLMPIAAEQGKVAGENAAGGNSIYKSVLPSPMIKVAGVSVLSIGSMEIPEGAKVYRKQEGENYSAAVVMGGKLTGAAFIGDTASGLKIKSFMEKNSEVGKISSFGDILKLIH